MSRRDRPGLAFRWVAQRLAPKLLVPVDPVIGWTRADLDRVLARVRAL